MSAGAGTPAGEPSGAQMMRVLIPAGAIALVVIATAVIVSGCEKDKPGSGKDGKSGPGPAPTALTSGPGRPMPSDGSDGGTEDPGLKPLGDRGLKYRDLKEGTGDPVKPGATATVHYTGWLANGDEFDSSRKPGRTPFPADLSGGVIQGWMDGVPGMKPGGVRKLVIPPELAYRDQRKGNIPPNSTLIFEVELVK